MHSHTPELGLHLPQSSTTRSDFSLVQTFQSCLFDTLGSPGAVHSPWHKYLLSIYIFLKECINNKTKPQLDSQHILLQDRWKNIISE